MSIEGKHSYRFVYLKSEEWQTVRIEALAREKGKCQICGEESIHNDAHHIWYPESIWNTRSEHLAILCRPCHDFIHTMTPDCKTSDESDGKRQWLMLSNAVSAWRRNKLELFNNPDGLKFKDPKDLRKKLVELKSEIEELRQRAGVVGNSEGKAAVSLVHSIQRMIKDFKKEYRIKEEESWSI